MSNRSEQFVYRIQKRRDHDGGYQSVKYVITIGLRGWAMMDTDYIPLARSAFSYLLTLPPCEHKSFPAANEAYVLASGMIAAYQDKLCGRRKA